MKFEALDAFRGIAAIMVLLFHSIFYFKEIPNPLVLHSDLFVDFFFILSGFVMSHAYQDKIKLSLSFKNFMIIRFARLYPLHLFTLLIWVPYVIAQIFVYSYGIGSTNPAEKQNFHSFFLNLFFLQTFAPPSGAGWNWPSWSVSVEFYLYLLFFYFFRLIHKYYIIYFVLVIFTCYSLLSFFPDPLLTNHIAFLRGIGGFFVGLFLYEIHRLKLIKINSFFIATLLEFLTLVGIIFSVSNYSKDLYSSYLLSILLFSLGVYFYSIQSIGIITKILQIKLFQFLGQISFSIYLLHGLILAISSNIAVYLFKLPKVILECGKEAIISNYSLLINTILILIVIILAKYSFRYIETPWLLKAKIIYKDQA